ncbi:hypothetical protein BJ122_102241 [Rhodopseudomonas faecalis]|uniref:Uncharacterized protein n=1 Tax=Rhodopseudomonas faecalis TaxID=99655 RepID=A0A318TT43_9BRAD|nr:hypothetical protein [Rhodopseudomonas faecalis]PYF05015.1 hypothetical protein BJ122_102241 [Rhodopseudomonas faecalis]
MNLPFVCEVRINIDGKTLSLSKAIMPLDLAAIAPPADPAAGLSPENAAEFHERAERRDRFVSALGASIAREITEGLFHAR